MSTANRDVDFIDDELSKTVAAEKSYSADLAYIGGDPLELVAILHPQGTQADPWTILEQEVVGG